MLPGKKNSGLLAYWQAIVPGQSAQETPVCIIHCHLTKTVGPAFASETQRHWSQEAAQCLKESHYSVQARHPNFFTQEG